MVVNVDIKCTCGKSIDRNDMGIRGHLAGKDHPELKFPSGKVKPKALERARYALKYSDTSTLNEPSTTQEERMGAKISGIS